MRRRRLDDDGLFGVGPPQRQMLRPLLADGGSGRAVAALPHVVQDGVSLEIVDEARHVARGVLLDDAAVVQIDLDLE